MWRVLTNSSKILNKDMTGTLKFLYLNQDILIHFICQLDIYKIRFVLDDKWKQIDTAMHLNCQTHLNTTKIFSIR